MGDICREHGIYDATFYNWKSKYGETGVSELKRMKELEVGNTSLKRIYAEFWSGAPLAKGCRQEKAVSPDVKGEMVHLMCDRYQVSILQGAIPFLLPEIRFVTNANRKIIPRLLP